MDTFSQDGKPNQAHPTKSPFRYRAFLSHEGTLKDGIISVLMAEVERHNMTSRVFFDTNMDRGGAMNETLKSRLLDGLNNSEYLVAFITPEFIVKKWPLWELKTYLEMMNADSRKKVLPVFYGVSVAECKDIVKDKATTELMVKIDKKPSDACVVLGKVVHFCGIDKLRTNKFLNDAEVIRQIMNTLVKVREKTAGHGAGLFPAGAPWPEQFPPDSNRFYGNEKLLEEIAQGLRVGTQEDQDRRSAEPHLCKCIISDIAGVGKSTLAAQFACKNRAEYPGGVYWIEAENEIDLFTSFKRAVAQIHTLVEDTAHPKDGHSSMMYNTAQRVHKTLEGIGSHKLKMTRKPRISQKAMKTRVDIDDDIETSTFEAGVDDAIETSTFEARMEMAAQSVRDLFQMLGFVAGKWLIMFDNLDNISGAKDFRVKWMPRSDPGNVLQSTTMRPHLEPYINFRDTLGLSIDVKWKFYLKKLQENCCSFRLGTM